MKPFDFTVEFFEEHYMKQKKGFKQIADEIGFGESYVRNKAKTFGFKNRHQSVRKIMTKEFLEEHYIRQNKSGHKIAKEFNLKDEACIYYWLRKHGLPVRENKNQVYPTGKNHKGWKGYEEISGGYWNIILHGAKIRSLPFEITKEYVWDLFIKQDKRCALSGVTIHFGVSGGRLTQKTASLDRIDSSKGYIKGNVRWVHKEINLIKNSWTDDEFIRWCHIVSDFQRKGVLS